MINPSIIEENNSLVNQPACNATDGLNFLEPNQNTIAYQQVNNRWNYDSYAADEPNPYFDSNNNQNHL